jgi:hypothetical protein
MYKTLKLHNYHALICTVFANPWCSFWHHHKGVKSALNYCQLNEHTLSVSIRCDSLHHNTHNDRNLNTYNLTIFILNEQKLHYIILVKKLDNLGARKKYYFRFRSLVIGALIGASIVRNDGDG